MKTITSNDLFFMLRERYPNIRGDIDDAEYDVLTEAQAKEIYNSFQRSMWKVKLTQWLKNKLDCDKWAKLLIAHVIVRNALSGAKNAKAIGLLRYRIGGDANKGHAINVCVIDNGSAVELRELEPQPRNGLTKLSQVEQESAWSYDF